MYFLSDTFHNLSSKMWSTPLVLVVFTAVVKALEQPQQIHLSLGDSDDQMTVMWATSNDVEGHVVFGESTVELEGRTNSTTAVLQGNNWKALKFIHRAQMTGLKAGCTYFYRVILTSGSERTQSDTHSFKTLTPNTTVPRKYLIYGDLGKEAGKPTFPVLKEEVDSGQYDVIWHVGDFAYDLVSDGGKTGDDFLQEIQPIAASLPYMTAPGNHELTNQLHHYRTRFSMPGTSWPMAVDKLWYSYNIGLVHFISYSTEVYFMNNQDLVCQQYDWLLKDLTAANKNRDKQPWIIAMGHRPMYCSNQNADDCTGRIFGYWVKYGLEDLFYGQGVDLIIQAHEHSYERLWPVYREEIFAKNYRDPRAPVHVTSGAAGCGEGTDKMGTPDPWSAFRAGTNSFHSFGKLTIHNSTHLHFVQETVKPRGELDSFWLVQHSHGPRLEGLDCQNGSKSHSICICPFPFHYVTVAITTGVALLLVVVVTCFLCCKFCCCRSRKTYAKLSLCNKLKLKLTHFHRKRNIQYTHPVDCDTSGLLESEDIETVELSKRLWS